VAALVVLSFTSDNVSKILAGRKCGTTRLPSTLWRRVVDQIKRGETVVAHIYNGNPRAGGELLFKGIFVEGVLCHGRDFEPEMILMDGFDSQTELAARLWKHYGKGKADPKSALEWWERQLWTWFQFELPDPVIVDGATMTEVPLNSA
jgi:hypothetical protein